MFLLTESTGKIIKFGADLVSNGETNAVDLDMATVKEIVLLAEVNGIEIKAKKKVEIISEIADWSAKNILENTEMSEEQKFEQIVVDGFAAEKSDNDIMREMFDAGCDFGDIKAVFNAAIKAKGLRLNAKDRAVKTTEFLDGYMPDINDVSSHLAKVTALQDFLKVTSTLAGASMRKWAKDNEITLPKAKAEPKRAPGFAGNTKIVADWALANPNCSKEELDDYAKANVPKTTSGKEAWSGHANIVWSAILFAKEMYAPAVEEVTEETEAA